MLTSRPAERIVTEKPASRSTSVITIRMKNTECAAPLTSRNSTRKATKTKVDSRWSTIEEFVVRVDLTTSTNSRIEREHDQRVAERHGEDAARHHREGQQHGRPGVAAGAADDAGEADIVEDEGNDEERNAAEHRSNSGLADPL